MRPVSSSCPGPSRRAFLELGAYSLCGLGLGDLARAAVAPSTRAPSSDDPAVIFVWLPGGPPHMEMYDMKPDAPAEYRGIFQPVRTNNPDLQVCELMPMHAKCADRFNIIRSVHHGFADHGGGHKRFMTARKPKEPTGFVNDAPAVTSFIEAALKEDGAAAGGLPTNLGLIRKGRDQIDVFSLGAAWMGQQNTPFIINGDPNEDGFKIDNLTLGDGMADRLHDRVALLEGIDQMRRDIDASGAMSSMDAFNQQAMEMLYSESFRSAFDLSKEPASVRDRFGRHAWGQRAILARRLVEAGARFVTVVMENPYVSGIKMPSYGTYNWDSHAVNCHIFDDARMRLPIYDRVISAMVEDLYSRGLDKRVMLVVTGEFGRTPRIETRAGTQTKVMQPGRDHWPNAMSMLVSGGGMRTGQVIGATDAKGEYPTERALTPNDLWASVLAHLRIDQNRTFLDHGGRPHPILPFGEPIRELAG